MIPKIDFANALCRQFILCFAFAILPAVCGAQQDSLSDAGRQGFGLPFPLPFARYTPETSWQFGVTLLWNADLSSEANGAGEQVSSIQPYIIYSVKKQFVVGAKTELFLDNGNLKVAGSVSHRYFPTSFWGVGNTAPDSAEEDYTPKELALVGRVQKRFGGAWYVGGLLNVGSRSLFEVAPGGLLATGSVPGSVDGQFVGVGLTATFDGREHTMAPRDGFYLDLETRAYGKWLGADYGFVSASIDARRFFPLGVNATLAARGLVKVSSGDLPFDMMPRLGGEELLRGYFEGRYRDKNLLALQTELRFPIWWRFSGVAFGGMGQVAPRLGDFSLERFHLAGGGGLRFLLQPQQRLNLRADFGVGSGVKSFYMGMQEAF